MRTDDDAKRRAGEIERYAVLDDVARRDLQPLLDVARSVCDVPTATITVDAGARQHHLAAVGLPVDAPTDEFGLPEAVLDLPGLLVVQDVRGDRRFGQVPVGAARFHASAPLVSSSGVVIGRLCVLDVEPRQLDATGAEVLQVLAGRAMGVLELEARSRELDECRAELAEAHDDLRRSRDHLSLFAGQVSHDLRTPLTAVSANAEMLAAEPAVSQDADLTWMVDGISRAAQRMNTMIEQLLDYARNGGVPATSPTCLTSVFERAVEDLAPAVSEHGAEVTVEGLPSVEADGDQMYVVALNLLSNALRFSRPGVAPRVSVGADRRDHRWRVTVTDNGIGVPAEKQEAMFLLFARADKRTGGSGIGLAMVRRIVESHGGRTGMDLAPGGGTSVWFELPA